MHSFPDTFFSSMKKKCLHASKGDFRRAVNIKLQHLKQQQSNQMQVLGWILKIMWAQSVDIYPRVLFWMRLNWITFAHRIPKILTVNINILVLYKCIPKMKLFAQMDRPILQECHCYVLMKTWVDRAHWSHCSMRVFCMHTHTHKGNYI